MTMSDGRAIACISHNVGGSYPGLRVCAPGGSYLGVRVCTSGAVTLGGGYAEK